MALRANEHAPGGRLDEIPRQEIALLDAVRSAQLRYDEARTLRIIAVRNAREHGFSWERIARELGITKQAAWQQFSHVDEHLRDGRSGAPDVSPRR